MATYAGYFVSLQGILKLLNIIFGFVSFGCIIKAYEEELHSEMYFVVAVSGCLAASVLFFPVFWLTSTLDNNRGLKLLDFTYHVLMGMVLIVASGLVLHSAVKNKDACGYDCGWTDANKFFDKKVSAGAFSLMNSILYFAASVFIITSRNKDDATFQYHR